MFNSGANTNLTFDLTHQSISFAPNQNIEIRIPIINDYWEEYVRKVYIINAKFG